MNHQQSEIRDSHGNLVAHSNIIPGCVYGEILGVKLDKRMERIESNVGDARIDIQKLSTDIISLKSQVSGICSLTRELTNEVRTYTKIQTEAQHEKRIQKIEGHVRVVQMVGKLLMWIVSPLLAISGLIAGILKITNGG
jgi:hypothetical protein